MMTVITAKKQHEVTRFTIGCEDMAQQVAEKLKQRGYMVKVKQQMEPVERTEEERHRATRIIGEMYGH